MSYTYAQRKKAATRAPAAPSAAPERMDALARGAAKPTAETGHRADLSDAMRARMESSFGDVSALRESQTADSSLADREGAMAARGESVYGGASAPLSTASAAPAAGPMQASRKSDPEAARKAKMTPEELQRDEEAEIQVRAHQELIAPEIYNRFLGYKASDPKYMKRSVSDEKQVSARNIGDPLVIQKIIEKKYNSVNKLYDQMQKIKPGKNADKKRFELGTSDEAVRYTLFDSINQNGMRRTGDDKLFEEATNKYLKEHPEIVERASAVSKMVDNVKENPYVTKMEGEGKRAHRVFNDKKSEKIYNNAIARMGKRAGKYYQNAQITNNPNEERFSEEDRDKWERIWKEED